MGKLGSAAVLVALTFLAWLAWELWVPSTWASPSLGLSHIEVSSLLGLSWALGGLIVIAAALLTGLAKLIRREPRTRAKYKASR